MELCLTFPLFHSSTHIATGKMPVVPVVCRNGRDARCPSRAAWGPAGGMSLAEGRGRLPEPGRMAGGAVKKPTKNSGLAQRTERRC